MQKGSYLLSEMEYTARRLIRLTARNPGCWASAKSASQFAVTLTSSRRPAPMERAPLLRLNTNAVVHGSANPLLAAEIAFSCLHGNVAEKELDLIQLST
jgi:hypothetical protein